MKDSDLMTQAGQLRCGGEAPDAIWQTIHALVRFARGASGADGCAVFEFDEERNMLVFRDGSGVDIVPPENFGASREVVFQEGLTISSHPLRADGRLFGLLTFAFCGAAIDDASLAILDRMARVIDAVYHLPRSTARLARKIGSLEVELAAIKIKERTVGLLGEGSWATESVETVVRHVESVLEKCPAGVVLNQLLPHLEDRVAERKLVAQAKQFLQRRDGISEEQAYMQLRNRSRASRKRLREVAHELIAG